MRKLIKKTKIFLILLILPQFIEFLRSQKSKKRFKLRIKDLWPCPFDATKETNFDRHYVYHPAWAMRKILSYNPSHHIDISSTLHFSSMLSAVLPVHFYDFRPAKLELSNLKSSSQDIWIGPTKLSLLPAN